MSQPRAAPVSAGCYAFVSSVMTKYPETSPVGKTDMLIQEEATISGAAARYQYCSMLAVRSSPWGVVPVRSDSHLERSEPITALDTAWGRDAQRSAASFLGQLVVKINTVAFGDTKKEASNR
ncbi:hypothetical protein BU16DRAFT_537118 [Lophium mytilinum]|uniref:Uncharacterized protein n=1 Tax=Lophium mytilinum TaxID=390894 RepID=A0A6A6QZD8_9PEZI|nr:hypothetical protein BU16DRAFT_537118 [Lophium mytilinum]